MKYFLYILAMTFMRFIALMPDFILYRISDLLFVIVFYVVRYRKNVTSRNLKLAFPEHDEKTIKKIRKDFYRHLADLIIENAVVQFFPRKRLDKMYKLENPELYKRYFEQNRHVIILAGHYNNWEWAPVMSYSIKHKVLALYKPLHNKYFDQALQRSRTRFGAVATPMGQIMRTLYHFDSQSKPTLTGVIADQRPRKKEINFWVDFLGIKTAAYNGAERLARRYNAVVVTMNVKKIKRGKYTGETAILTETPNALKENEITKMFFMHLEKLIQEKPQYWLWSHKRWKISYDEWLEFTKNNK